MIDNHFNGFPPIVGVDGLSILLNKKPTSISVDRARNPGSLPPAYTPPGSQKPLWVVADVIDWLRQYKEDSKAGSALKPKKMGAPTKAERIRRREMQTKQ